MKKVVIFGGSGFAEVAYVYLTKDSPYDVAAFTVHGQYLDRPSLMGLDVVPFEEIVEQYPPDDFAMFIAVAFKKLNKARQELYFRCKEMGYELIKYVSSKAIHWGEIEIGDNCFIFENNVIQPFVSIGNNVVVWSGNHIGHHSRIGDHCFIASHAVISGNCRIDEGCFIGVNASLRDGIHVARNNIIGAGALIVKDTAENQVYRGVASKPMDVSSHDIRSI